MTTITFKDGVMAADSQQTHVYIDQVECRKLYVINGDLIGLAGNLTDFPKFINWYMNERKNINDLSIPNRAIDELQALVFSKNKLYFYDHECIAVPMTGKIASIGSGSPYAMGAMMAGSTAQEAIVVSSKLDPNTNAPIYSIDIKDVKNGHIRPVKYNGSKTTTRKKKKESKVLSKGKRSRG